MTQKEFFVPMPPDPEVSVLTVFEMSYERAEDLALSLADEFGLKGQVHGGLDTQIIADGGRILAVYPQSGAFWYCDAARFDNPVDIAELPDAKAAEEHAVKYLRKHKWLPEHFKIDRVSVGKRESIIDGEQGGQDTNVCVSFRPRFENIESYGPGGKIEVFLGQNGEVLGLVRAVATLRVHGKYPLLPKDEVRRRLERKMGQSLDKLRLTEAKLVYHAESMVLGPRFMQPTYLFELEGEVPSRKNGGAVQVPFEMPPIPATRFSPHVVIASDRRELKLKRGDALRLECDIDGGTEPYDIRWSSDYDGALASGPLLETDDLSVAHRQGKVLPHVITVTATDQNGMSDTDTIRVTVTSDGDLKQGTVEEGPDPYVGVEWCNVYGSPGLPHISGTDKSAKGFKDGVAALPGWSSRFDWGNGSAWEQDFKMAGAPGGGTDAFWADNVHFAFFAGHGSSGRFWFGSTVDDHEMRAEDARWGDGHLNWIVLHACQTMRSNFEWTVWCDAFNGLHQMFGFHTNTQGSTPPLGTRFAFWSQFKIWPWSSSLFDLRTAWRIACQECYDSSREYSIIYANQSGTDTANDHLPGHGFVSADPTTPNSWVYTKGSC